MVKHPEWDMSIGIGRIGCTWHHNCAIWIVGFIQRPNYPLIIWQTFSQSNSAIESFDQQRGIMDFALSASFGYLWKFFLPWGLKYPLLVVIFWAECYYEPMFSNKPLNSPGLEHNWDVHFTHLIEEFKKITRDPGSKISAFGYNIYCPLLSNTWRGRRTTPPCKVL